MGMSLTNEQTINEFIKELRKKMRSAKRYEISMRRGIIKEADETGMFWNAKPGGMTILIHLDGGAVDYESDLSGTRATRDRPGDRAAI